MVIRNLANFILIFKTLQPVGQHTIFRTPIEHLIMPGKNCVLCRNLLYSTYGIM